MGEQLHFGPLDIWRSMGIVGQLVLIFLLLMSIYSIWVMVDRYLFFAKARKQSLQFIVNARGALGERNLDAVLAEASKHPQSHLARLYVVAIYEFFQARDRNTPGPEFEETLPRAMEREAVLAVQEFKRGLPALASIGATAPFVGLFGTVIGIMNAFFGMATSGQAGIGAIAGGIAEALVNTAAGLFVALPAVWAYNYLLGRIERFSLEMSNAASELLDYFVKNFRNVTWKSAAVGR
jgi:biopolymer transport protein ExbB/biopolymer transport protein TolQ